MTLALATGHIVFASLMFFFHLALTPSSFAQGVCDKYRLLRYLRDEEKKEGIPGMHLNTGIIVLYFGLMEVIQFAQHLAVGGPLGELGQADSLDWLLSPSCQTFQNQFLAYLGVVHVCWQPYVIHRYAIGSTSAIYPFEWAGVVRFVRLGCCLDTFFLLIGFFGQAFVKEALVALFGNAVLPLVESLGPFAWETCGEAAGGRASGFAPWMVSKATCVAPGRSHLRWAIAAPAPTYYWSGLLHCFTFFGPYFLFAFESRASRDFLNMKNATLKMNIRALEVNHSRLRYTPLMGCLLLLSTWAFGSFLVGGNRYEAASTWCFHSVLVLPGLLAIHSLAPVWDKWINVGIDVQGLAGGVTEYAKADKGVKSTKLC